MEDYAKYISEKRRAVPTPKNIVDEEGKCAFGTFDKEFEAMDFLKAKKPTGAPQCMNRLKLTLWEATEVNLKDGILLTALCDMALFGKTLCCFYDKRTKKVYCWDNNLSTSDTHIAPNLINGSIAEAVTKTSRIKYINNFQDGVAELSGAHNGKCKVNSKEKVEATIEYDFKLTRISKPCVVSIPFGENRPLYSQKDFFKAEGKLIFNGEEMLTDENSTAIIDDHRGYYPRKAHYDWVTTMGVNETDGEKKFFAFNLTRNQSIDQENYNENLIWLKDETSILPPVTFTREKESKDFDGEIVWHVKDEHDMVNLTYRILGQNAMVVHALVVNIDYYINFGEISGYVRDESGKKYVLDGMIGIGEDKSLLF